MIEYSFIQINAIPADMWTFVSSQQPPDVGTCFNHDENDTNQRCRRESSSKQCDILNNHLSLLQEAKDTPTYPKLNDHFQIVSKLFIVFQGTVFKFLATKFKDSG